MIAYITLNTWQTVTVTKHIIKNKNEIRIMTGSDRSHFFSAIHVFFAFLATNTIILHL